MKLFPFATHLYLIHIARMLFKQKSKIYKYTVVFKKSDLKINQKCGTRKCLYRPFVIQVLILEL